MKFDSDIRIIAGRSVPGRLLSLALAAFFLAACGKQDLHGDPAGGFECSDEPVSFEAFGKWDDAPTKTISSGVETSFEAGDAMGVTAYYLPEGGSMDTAFPNFMYNQKVVCTAPATASSKAAWAYTPVKYWPLQGRLNFYAYSPYSGPEDDRISLSPNTEAGMPGLTYSNPNVDIDLLTASAEGLSWDPAHTSPVEFSFRHLLARVQFKFTVEGDDSFSPVVHILRYDIPYSSGKFASWDGDARWTDLQSPAEVYRRTKDVAGREVTAGGITVDEFTAYLLPCSFPSSDGTGIGKFRISLNNIEQSFAPAELVSVKAGHTYTLNFKIQVTSGGQYFITSFSMWGQGEESWNADLK